MYPLIAPAYISFATPGMLAGAALAVFPLTAHLLNRYARAKRLFPSLFLLQQSVAQRARIAKWRRWLLLLLRCLFVAAVAAAFARPVWRQGRQEALAAAQGNAAVLLVDTSASMQVTRNGVPLIDVAKAAGDRVLRDLRRGVDVANVIFVATRAEPVFAALSPNLPALQNELKRQTATLETADMAAGLRAAGQLLETFRGPRRLVILSDLQAVSWQSLLEARPTDLLPAETQVSVVDLQVPPPQNVAIHRPRHDPVQPLIGQIVTLSAQLQNDTDQLRQVRVTARVDQQDLPPVQVALEPGQRRDVSFETSWDRPGPHEVQFETDHDAFSLDDRCYWVTHSHPGIPVALLTDEDPARTGSAGHYLSLALAPHKDANDRFAVQTLSARDLPLADLDDNATLLVGYLGLLEQPAAERLVQYMQQGGACVFFCGQGPVRRNLLLLDELLPEGCLPWLPGARQDLYRQRKTRHITRGNWRSRLLRDFDATSQLALAGISFGSLWQVERVRGEAEVLLSFDDGTPALAMRSVGRGRLVLANFSPEEASSELGKHGVFVALAQTLAQNLRPADALAVRRYVGQRLVHRLAPGMTATDVRVVDPQGQRVESTLNDEGTATQLHVAATRLAGIYRLQQDDHTLDAIAVNLDPAESDLQTVVVQQVRDALAGPGGASQVVAAGAWQRPFDLEGRPLWGWMILLAMACVGTELALLGWWRR
jgi:hypothetical protein